jgi:ABC-type sugar transport system substrate-binding protein
MRPLTKGLELFKYYQEKYEKIVILSAAGDSSNAEEIERAKREWIKEHIGDVEVHIVDKAENKFTVTKQYPQFQNHMLIDDRKKAIDPWIDNGGIGILFV